MELIEKIKQEIAEFDVKRKTLVEELRHEFPKLGQPLFDKSKKIESIGWTQYTPYFNDGDSCEFGVNFDLYINGSDQYDIEDEDNFFKEHLGYGDSRRVNPNYDPNEAKILEDFQLLLQEIPEDFYEDLFGDHAQVTMHKDGRIEVEEYDHE